MITYDQIRLIALDLDGTLLHEDKSISEYTLHTLEALVRRGLILLPDSGRDLGGMEDNILKVPGISYAACSNGAIVYRLPSRKILYESAISVEDALTAINCLEQYPVSYYAHTTQGTIRSHNWNQPGFQEKFPFIRSQKQTVSDMAEYLMQKASDKNFSVLKLGFYVLEDALFAELLKKGSSSPSLSFTQTGDGTIEINSVHASKGTALAALCRKLGISPSHTLAIGDSGNDLSMLRQAGVSVAMGNALDDVRAIADYVAGRNDEDGAAGFLHQFFHL